MRAQFFMDARDYVKYSFLEDAMRSPSLRQLTLIWMLTPDVPNGHGRRRPRLEPTRPELNAFFARHLGASIADVAEYFRQRGFVCNSYGDSPPAYLTADSRFEYFAQIPDSYLYHSLVFLDPDNGVEPRSAATTAHIRLSELDDLWRRMHQSILVIYQHKPRVPSRVYWPEVASRVTDVLSTPVSWLSCGDMGFLLAGANEDLSLLAAHVREIGAMYNLGGTTSRVPTTGELHLR